MSNTVVYSAINTKIRVLERNFLRKKDYQNLLKMATVSDAAAYLKENTYYSNLLTTIDTDIVSRRDIEGIFKVSMAGNIDKLIYFFHNDYKKLIH
ncbi:MAG TPA: V-type ATPase subunit, partial [Atribacterota bacterium]|nr:V-type ATPase subunit [Atribacterota bacterium]